MDQSKLKTIAYMGGGLALIVGGLIYVLLSDLLLLNTAQWLFFGIAFAFGSGFAMILSESLKSKAKWFYIVKGIAVACAIMFIVAIFLYAAHARSAANIAEVIKVKGYTTPKTKSLITLIEVFGLVFGFAGIAAQGADIALNAVYGIDD